MADLYPAVVEMIVAGLAVDFFFFLVVSLLLPCPS